MNHTCQQLKYKNAEIKHLNFFKDRINDEPSFKDTLEIETRPDDGRGSGWFGRMFNRKRTVEGTIVLFGWLRDVPRLTDGMLGMPDLIAFGSRLPNSISMIEVLFTVQHPKRSWPLAQTTAKARQRQRGPKARLMFCQRPPIIVSPNLSKMFNFREAALSCLKG